MTPEEFKELQLVRKETPKVHIDLLEDQSDRTLLWGYTVDRCDWHVYIKHGEIHRLCIIVQDGKTIQHHECREEYEPQSLVPDKRLYDDACDFEFCKLLKKMGAVMSFTGSGFRKLAQYYGPIR